MTRIAQTLILGCCMALACDPDDSDDAMETDSGADDDDDDDGGGGGAKDDDDQDDDQDGDWHGSDEGGSSPPLPDGFDACDQTTFQDVVVSHCESLTCNAGVDDCVLRYLYLAENACYSACSEELFGLLSCVTDDGAVCPYAEDEVCGADVGLLDFCCAGCV